MSSTPIALVTGASGFIGSTLIAELNRRGVRVLAMLRKSSSLANLEGLKYERVEADLSDATALAQALRKSLAGVEKIDWVFHLAGVVKEKNRDGFFKHNATGSKVLAQALLQTGIPIGRVVAASSLSAAGPAKNDTPLAESVTCAPVSFYGESKLQSEKELSQYKDQLPLVFVRPPMVYGPRDREVFLIVQTIARGLKPLLPSRVRPRIKKFSAIHAMDLVQGMILAAQAPLGRVPSGEVFFLSDDGVYADTQMFGYIEEALGKRAIAIPIPLWLITVVAHVGGWVSRVTGKLTMLNPDKLNEMTPAYWICSNQKAKQLLGFQPQYNFQTGMRDAVDWYRQNRWI